MSLMLTRTFAYFTLISYLIVGTVAVRFCMPEFASVSFTTSYLNLVSDAPVEVAAIEESVTPDIQFASITIPHETVIKKIQPKIVKIAVKKDVIIVKEEVRVIAHNELPFHEPVTLTKITVNEELSTNLMASYKDFSFTETLVAETDTVSTKQASPEEVETAEPEFFEYPVVDAQKTATAPKADLIEKSIEETNTAIAASSSNEVETEDVSELVEPQNVPETTASVETEKEPEFFDYPTVAAQAAAPVVAASPVAAKVVASSVPTSSSLVTFDYSKANQDIVTQTIPTVSKVTTHKSSPVVQAPASSNKSSDKTSNALMADVDKSLEKEVSVAAPTTYPVSLSILAMGSDLKKLENLQGFEVRFQDDLTETMEDFGAGEVKFETTLSQPKMTRAVTLLKRGFVPTSTEIILEEGTGSVSVPMIDDETFNEAQRPFERRGAVGALLVELDDESELAKIDVPFGNVIKLNGDFKATEAEDFRYQLFVGVKAGNALVSYHRGNGEIVSKIIHVHENEVTYDANFYEDVVNEKVRLYEEDLLAKESSPLIISGDQVKVFASNSTAKKINNHTYKMNFGASHLGGRRYLELTHGSEPLFVGIRDNNHVTVPSENFMRFILSKVEGNKLGNRCMVQVNLTKTAEKFDVASESVAASLSTYSQVLDNDGKFYDTLSEKTQKIMIVGESQGSEEISADAKINIKIQYTDGSVQFLNSYCSPNTYLVEQL